MSDLVKQEQQSITLTDPALIFHSQWNKWLQIAQTMYKSGMLNPKTWDSPEKIMLGFMKCHELGIPIMTGIQGMFPISGKIGLEVSLQNAIIDSKNECEVRRFDEKDGECICYVKRKNGREYTAAFTVKDAQKAGLIKKDSAWEKYPKDMLRNRANGICNRIVFSDILRGLVYSPEELGVQVSVNDNGDEYAETTEIQFDEAMEFKRIIEKIQNYQKVGFSADDLHLFMENNIEDVKKMSNEKQIAILRMYNMEMKRNGKNDFIIRLGEDKSTKPDNATEESTKSDNGTSGDNESTEQKIELNGNVETGTVELPKTTF